MLAYYGDYDAMRKSTRMHEVGPRSTRSDHPRPSPYIIVACLGLLPLIAGAESQIAQVLGGLVTFGTMLLGNALAVRNGCIFVPHGLNDVVHFYSDPIDFVFYSILWFGAMGWGFGFLALELLELVG